MKTKYWLLALGFMISPLWAQNKAAFDLDGESFHRSSNEESVLTKSAAALAAVSEFTLLPGGYFTIGTQSGLSASPLDDRCAITFGHPYALTSYPLLAVDGAWSKPDEYFTAWETQPVIAGDTLKIELEKSGVCSMSFYLLSKAGGATVEIGLRLKNLDTIAHSLAVGLVFDPALGKWGDGYAFSPPQSAHISEAALLQGQQVPAQLEIWERPQGTRGLGAQIDFGASQPQSLILNNWKDVYNDPAPIFPPGEKAIPLYDLTLKMNWEEKQVAPGEETGFAVQVSLLQPVFSPLFLRWDLPSFLSLENNKLFPRDFPVTVHAADFSNPRVSDATLTLQLPDEISGDASSQAIVFSSENFAYQTRLLTSREIYEDRVVNVSITCRQGGAILDHISRNVFIPATPVSDTGLAVAIDTVFTDKFPEIGFVFWAENQSTQQKIFKLRPENLFLFENEQRINDFSIIKETGGGLDLVDVIFVLDVSGSMGDNIREVSDNIVEFSDSLVARGFDFRIGVVTFSTTVDAVWDLTNDVHQIQANLDGIQLWGGIEDSPAALYRATELSLRPGSKRTIIWITDEPYPEVNYTKEAIVNRMLSLDITVHGVGLLNLQTDWFDPIVLPTGGNFYDINGNFRDVLLDISRLDAGFLHRVTYTSPSSGTGAQQIRLEIHYAGLAGEATIDYARSGANLAKPLLACYPNPFNPQTKIYIDNPAQSTGAVAIYNVLGQKVREFSVSPKQRAVEILWDARDERELPVAAGLYFVQLSLRDQFGKIQTQAIRKILYVK